MMKRLPANEAASSKEFEQRVHDSNSNLDLNESVHFSKPREGMEIGKDVAEEVLATLDSNSDDENGNKDEVNV